MKQIKTIKEIDERLKVLFTLRDGFNDVICHLTEKRKNLLSDEYHQFTEDLTPEKFMMFRDWHRINEHIYNKLTKWFDKNYFSKGVYREGTHIYTKQAGLKIKMNQNQPFANQLGILDFLPHIQPAKTRDTDKEEICYIGIFEYSCSERYSYSLRANKEKTRFWVQNHVGHVYLESSDLLEILEYIYNNFPYERRSKNICSIRR